LERVKCRDSLTEAVSLHETRGKKKANTKEKRGNQIRVMITSRFLIYQISIGQSHFKSAGGEEGKKKKKGNKRYGARPDLCENKVVLINEANQNKPGDGMAKRQKRQIT